MSNILVTEGGDGIWEGVYMTLAVAAYHWFLLHWSENLHPRFQIPNSPSDVNCVPGKLSALNAGNFEVFQVTRSYNTSFERSHQFLKAKKVYMGIAVI